MQTVFFSRKVEKKQNMRMIVRQWERHRKTPCSAQDGSFYISSKYNERLVYGFELKRLKIVFN